MLRLLLACVLTLLAAAPPAWAATRAEIIRDCYQDGKLDGSYRPSEIRDARNNLPADIDQYSDCRDVLGRALGGSGSGRVPDQAGSGGVTGGGSGGGTGAAGAGGASSGAPLTAGNPAEQEALESAAQGSAPVEVDGSAIVPGASGFATGAARNALPVSVLVVLILLGLTALAAAVPPVRRRVVARRRA
jgi:hypothetical protein